MHFACPSLVDLLLVDTLDDFLQIWEWKGDHVNPKYALKQLFSYKECLMSHKCFSKQPCLSIMVVHVCVYAYVYLGVYIYIAKLSWEKQYAYLLIHNTYLYV